MDCKQDEDDTRGYSEKKKSNKSCKQVKPEQTSNKNMIYDNLSCFISPSVFSPEAQAFGTMLVAYGYVYPLQNHKKLVMCNDATLYRFQVK